MAENSYPFKEIEKKWQKRWDEKNCFKVDNESNGKKKFYCLIEFPFPSGSGLHVGHARPYTAMDTVARYHRMKGENVLFPIGLDSFGAQAEQYAIKTGQHPKVTTELNTETYVRQLKDLGFSFDWDRFISTSRPEYYKWTQWMFIQFFKKGLAYKSQDTINWCPACKMALTNEELEQGKCERCGGDVIQKVKSQWTLKMKSYSEDLLEGLDHVGYSENIKAQQRNWIGKSVGAEVDFTLSNGEKLKVFTTRADTMYGVTFMVIAPEHNLTLSKDISNKDAVDAYKIAANKKTEMARLENKEKSGVKLEGIYAVNPFDGKQIPIFISDYVMMGYGTGAIMAVPAHDTRDFEFASMFGLDITRVIDGGELPYEGDGRHVNSGFMDGMDKDDAINAAITKVESEKIGKKTINYKMKDWLFSRQRYWGEPVPMVFCECCGWQSVPDNQLPVVLPDIDDYLPTDDGESPLAKATDWVNTTCPVCGKAAKRETDTMPNWAGSSWYFLRYMDPKNNDEFASKDALNYWGQVDLYEGGQEHTTRHLLYARFWNQVLFDLGLVPNKEPFKNRFSHGLILAEDGSKMSKSKNNIVSPDDVINEFGTDSLRIYEMFIAPFSEDAAWSTSSIIGVSRFLNRVYKMIEKIEDREMNKEEKVAINKTIKDVTERMEATKFNTVVSAYMECLNAVSSQDKVAKEFFEKFLAILNPYAPHLCEELWEKLGHNDMLVFHQWPEYNEKFLMSDEINFIIQINGKLRSEIKIKKDLGEDEIKKLALADEKASKFIVGDIKKIIIVPNKLINIVV